MTKRKHSRFRNRAEGFEPAKAEYSEWQFYLFDYLLASAATHNIFLEPSLENYWEAYGGIDARLGWEGLPSGDHASRTRFFDKQACPGCFDQYKAYASHVMNRTNHYSGVQYKDDPTIFAWELMNEPRYQDGGEDSSGTTLRAWVDEMSQYIKSIDPNHMVSIGLEAHESRYGFGGDEGNPFIYLHESPAIDFCTGHLYPTEPWADLGLAEADEVIAYWIDDAHNVVGKPFVMGEFNSHSWAALSRTEWFTLFFGAIEKGNAAGSQFWWYSDNAYDTNFGVTEASPELAVFRAHAAVMNAKSQ